MWPVTGRFAVVDGWIGRFWPHNDQSDDSQLSSDSSDRQAGRGRDPAEVSGGSVVRSACIFALVLISAYGLVVVRSAWPSQPRMTLISTPASSRWTAAVWRKICGLTLRLVRASSRCPAWRRTIL